MREEEEESWFARWEEQLLRPEELTPLSQTLITPDLALAFDIAAPPPPSAAASHPPHRHHQAEEYEGGGEAAGGEEPARTLKRPRLVWTPQLHKRFVDAVAHLGIKNAVPKTIMQLMSVDGLTRENVASHLQKYRLYLKRMQGPAAAAAGCGGGVSPADQQLFATAPVPHHLLSPMAALHHHHMAAAAQQQYYQLGHFGSPPGAGSGFDHHGFLPRATLQPGFHHMVGPAVLGVPYAPAAPAPAPAASYVEDLESGTAGGEGGRRILTLFPTGDD